MKKILFLSVFLCAFFWQGNAQVKNFKDLYAKYENDTEVKCLNVNNFATFILAMCIPDSSDEVVKRLIKDCSGVYMLVGGEKRKKELDRDVSEYIRKSKLEEVMQVKEDGKDIGIYIQNKGEQIIGFLITVNSANEMILVQINGKFSPSLLKEIVKSN